MKGVGYRWGEAKAKLELRLSRDKKNNRKGSYSRLTRKRRSKKVYTLPPINNAGKLVAMEEEKAGVPTNFCLSLQWQPLFPHLSNGWTAGWEL